MTHAEMRDLYELYALGVLEPEERVEIDEHLGTGCETCRAGVRAARATNTAIFLIPDEVDPPKRLRRRVLAGFGVQRNNWAWMAGWATVAAGLLIATLWYSTQAQRVQSELTVARRELGRSAGELTRLETVMQFLNSPETRQVTFGKGTVQPPRGTVLLNPANGVLLIASNLPALPSGKTYEMWVIPKGGAPRPAGLFHSDQQGNAIHLERGPVDPNTGAVAVTVEPESGSAAPTSTPIVVAPVPGA